MTDKQAVREKLDRLPESASLEEITEELQIMAAVRQGRADIAAGRSQPQAKVAQLIRRMASVKSKPGKSAAAFKARLNRISRKPLPGVSEVFNRVRG